jgi:thiol-disulfide isomerase/thioredoxin
MGREKPAAGMLYKGRAYYLCNTKEIAEFKKDPEAFVPPILPRPAPAIELKTLSGETTALSAMKGKVVLLDFWATWCKPCIETMPALQKLHEKYGDKGLTVVGASIDEKGAAVVEPFLKNRKFTYSMMLDGGAKPAWQSLGIRSIPALFLIKDGQIVQQWVGKPKESEVESAVSELLK